MPRSFRIFMIYEDHRKQFEIIMGELDLWIEVNQHILLKHKRSHT
jgi:hypothetical protein